MRFSSPPLIIFIPFPSQLHRHPQRLQPLYSLQLPKREVFDGFFDEGLAAEVIQVLQILLLILAGGIDDGDFAGLRQAFRGAVYEGFVNALFDDFVADIVRAIHIELLVVHAETDGNRVVINKDQLCRR